MIYSFLMVGQSNMSGRGWIGEVPEINNPDCKMYRNARWTRMSEPVSIEKQFAKATNGGLWRGVTLATSFADAVQRKYGCEVGSIPCAYGGTKIEQWMPGTDLFDNAVFQAKLAMRTSTFVGILWHQGESNSKTEEDTLQYESRLSETLAAMRREIGAEHVPVILGELGAQLVEIRREDGTFGYPFGTRVNDCITRVAASDPHYGLVSAEGLSTNSDQLHFSSEALRTFGLRYFEEYERVSKRVGFEFTQD